MALQGTGHLNRACKARQEAIAHGGRQWMRDWAEVLAGARPGGGRASGLLSGGYWGSWGRVGGRREAEGPGRFQGGGGWGALRGGGGVA